MPLNKTLEESTTIRVVVIWKYPESDTCQISPWNYQRYSSRCHRAVTGKVVHTVESFITYKWIVEVQLYLPRMKMQTAESNTMRVVVIYISPLVRKTIVKTMIHCDDNTVLVHCADTLWWYTVMIHCEDILWWYSLMVYCDNTVGWYTVDTVDVLCWCTVTIYCDDTLWWYTVMIHCDDTLVWYRGRVRECVLRSDDTLWWYTVMIQCDDTLLILLIFCADAVHGIVHMDNS